MMMVGAAGTVFTLVAGLVWVTGLTTVAVVAEEQALADPLIASAKVSTDLTTLSVSGLNFVSDGTTPSVSLALTALPVTSASATAVTATLPESLEAGTYLLLLTRGDQQAAAFYVTVDAGVAVCCSSGSDSKIGPGLATSGCTAFTNSARAVSLNR